MRLSGVFAALTLAALAGAWAATPALGQPALAPEAKPWEVTSWRDMPFRRVVRQQYDYSCGSAAVATLLTFHYGRPTSEADAFKSMFATGDQSKIRVQGFSMLDMKGFLATRGLPADGYRIPLSEIEKAKSPAIVLIQNGRYKHFVVVKGVRGGMVVMGDPALGERAMTIAEFTKVWNGVVLVVHPDAESGAFNHKADWELRPGAPWDEAVSRLTVADIGAQVAPIYQLSMSVSVPGAAR
jgi:predicted double-glycine peptidase